MALMVVACEHSSPVLRSTDAPGGGGGGGGGGGDANPMDAPGGMASGAVGDPCTQSTQCHVSIDGSDEGECVTASPFSNGYCSGRVAECSAPGSNPCPSGAVCVAPGISQTNGEDYCVKQCGSNGDCRVGDGYQCCPTPDGRGSACYPASLCT